LFSHAGRNLRPCSSFEWGVNQHRVGRETPSQTDARSAVRTYHGGRLGTLICIAFNDLLTESSSKESEADHGSTQPVFRLTPYSITRHIMNVPKALKNQTRLSIKPSGRCVTKVNEIKGGGLY